jgi:prophage maintenance system killer protein
MPSRSTQRSLGEHLLMLPTSSAPSRLSKAHSRDLKATRTTRMRTSHSRQPCSAHGIAEGQPFLDGNKRLALVAMLTFLEANGCRIDATDPELADWIIGFSGDLTPETLAEQLRSRLVPD